MSKQQTPYELIDNFIPSDVFAQLTRALIPPSSEYNVGEGSIGEQPTEQVPWCYSPADNVVSKGNEKGTADWRLFYLTHVVYAHTIASPLYGIIIPHLNPLGIKALIRIKINMYPNTETLKEHGMHSDHPFSHKAAILSINTCNGYTKLEDGTKIDSVANRMLLFDPSTLHSSSTTTDQPVRVNINMNYF